MNTVTINFIDTTPTLEFTGVTSFKYDPNTGTVSIVHDGGNYDDIPVNVSGINIS